MILIKCFAIVRAGHAERYGTAFGGAYSVGKCVT